MAELIAAKQVAAQSAGTDAGRGAFIKGSLESGDTIAWGVVD
jgi:hypothetical protein